MPSRYWAVVPAAGVGRRMADGIPKQYLELAGRTAIEWSLAPLLADASIEGILVALADQDARWSKLACARDSRIQTTTGGVERSDSVLKAIQALSAKVNEDDWLLVHDAARPCLHAEDLSQLVAAVGNDSVGGLLAVPVSDTLKSADEEQRVAATVPRERLWRALTPQMFRFGLLRRALTSAAEKGIVVTDESSAVEALGLRPKLIAGRADNIKITVPEDLVIAEQILRSRTSA